MSSEEEMNRYVMHLMEQLHESRKSNVDKDRAIEELQSLVRVYKKLRLGCK